MQQGFGRRGVVLNGQPVGNEPDPEKPARPHYVNEDGSLNGWRRGVVVLICIVLFLAWIEAATSGTSLLTPISSTTLWIMRAIGAVVGLIVAILLKARITQNSSAWRAWLAILIMPLLFAVLFDGVAWRVADWVEFGSSREAFSPARYPIKSVSHGRKGRRDTLSIDPFDTGEDADLPISDAQYDQLSDMPEGTCVTVMQRKNAHGAIEILNDGEYTMNEPEPRPVGDCDAAIQTIGPSSNPWNRN